MMNTRTTTILALDAAWTEHKPSGVALVQGRLGTWSCLAVAPSYDEFLALARAEKVTWSGGVSHGSRPDVPRLLKAAQEIAGAAVDLVTVDMPIATIAFDTRREADRAISREFGAQGCSTHSPSSGRPGKLGRDLTSAFEAQGFQVATAVTPISETGRLVEVYPHPALLSLLGRNYRVPYKVVKSNKYWPERNVRQRIAALLDEFGNIRDELAKVFAPLQFPLPAPQQVPSLAALKPYEDALDALVCAWVGVKYRQGNARAYGDATAAIWCPN